MQRFGIVRIFGIDRNETLHGDKIDCRIGAHHLAYLSEFVALHPDYWADIERILWRQTGIDCSESAAARR